MIHGRWAPGTSGAIIVYDLCTTTGGTLIYPPYDYYYSTVYTSQEKTYVTTKRVKMRRPSIAEPDPPWKLNNKKINQLKLNKIPFNGCCHMRYE